MGESGQITEEGVARLRARIGVPEPHPMPPLYRRPGEDAFRQVAVAYGDDNPLWCDPEYGKKTRWGGLIAPPNFSYTMGEGVDPKNSALSKLKEDISKMGSK